MANILSRLLRRFVVAIALACAVGLGAFAIDSSRPILAWAGSPPAVMSADASATPLACA